MKKNDRLDIRLPESQKQILFEIARKLGMTVSEVIRQWIDQKAPQVKQK